MLYTMSSISGTYSFLDFHLMLLVLYVLSVDRTLAVVGPDNNRVIMVFEGEPILLTCNMPGSIIKEDVTILKNEESALCRTDDLDNINRFRYSASIKSGTLIFTIKKALLGDAAYYVCQSIDSKATVVKVNIIVMGMPTIITSGRHIEGSQISSECILHYRTSFFCSNEPGAIQENCPHIWLSYKNIAARRQAVNCRVVDDVSRECSATVTHEHIITREDDGLIRSCIVEGGTGNAISYNSSLVVKYGVAEPLIEPMKETYTVGEDILCDASGNPPPTYTWRNNVNNQKIQCQKLHMTIDMKGKNNWTCRAHNEPDITVFQEETVVVFVVNGSMDSKNMIIIVVVSAAAVLLIWAAWSGLGLRRRSGHRDGSTSGATDLLHTQETSSDVTSV